MKMSVAPSKGRIAPVLVRRRFEQPQRCRADRDDAPAGRSRRVEPLCDFAHQCAALGMHLVARRILRLHRQECARPDMQREELARDAGRVEPSISSGVKCRPAVGAATAPSSAA